MKQFAKTISYTIKHAWLLLLFAVPAALFALFVQSGSLSQFVAEYPNTTILGFNDLFGLLTQVAWQNVLWFVLAGVLLAVALSVFVGMIEKHFKSGTLKLNFFANINNNILFAITYLVYLFCLVFLYKFVLAVLLYAVHIVFSGMGSVPGAFTFAFAVALVAISFAGLVYLFNYFLLAFPATILNGYNIRTSLSDASELLNKRQFKTNFGMLVVFVIAFLVQLLGQLYGFAVVGNMLVYMMMAGFLPLYGFVCYYDYANLKRYDLPKQFKYTV